MPLYPTAFLTNINKMSYTITNLKLTQEEKEKLFKIADNKEMSLNQAIRWLIRNHKMTRGRTKRYSIDYDKIYKEVRK